MTAISSIKPFKDSAAVAENQRRAKATWDRAFSKVLYVGPESEPQLEGLTTRWIKGDPWPLIADLIAVAAAQPDWSCLINADIRVSFRLRMAEMELRRLEAESAFSFRFQLPECRVVDQGLDFFAARPEVWKTALRHVPKWHRIGHVAWDTWMLAFLSQTRCYDLTPCCCIYHPRHEDRVRPYPNAGRLSTDDFMRKMTIPKRQILLPG